MITRPETWRTLSTILLLVGVVGLLLGSAAGWWALIASGVAFVIELVLVRRRGQAAER